MKKETNKKDSYAVVIDGKIRVFRAIDKKSLFKQLYSYVKDYSYKKIDNEQINNTINQIKQQKRIIKFNPVKNSKVMVQYFHEVDAHGHKHRSYSSHEWPNLDVASARKCLRLFKKYHANCLGDGVTTMYTVTFNVIHKVSKKKQTQNKAQQTQEESKAAQSQDSSSEENKSQETNSENNTEEVKDEPVSPWGVKATNRKFNPYVQDAIS